MLACFLIVILDLLFVLELNDTACTKTVREDKHAKQQKSIVEFTKMKNVMNNVTESVNIDYDSNCDVENGW